MQYTQQQRLAPEVPDESTLYSPITLGNCFCTKYKFQSRIYCSVAVTKVTLISLQKQGVTSLSVMSVGQHNWQILLCKQQQQARREGGKGGKFSLAPRRLGGPPSLKNTENGVPDGFFLS